MVVDALTPPSIDLQNSVVTPQFCDQEGGSNEGGWRQLDALTAGVKERSKNFKKNVDAERWANQVETAKPRGDWIDPKLGKVSFEDFSREWLESVSHVSPVRSRTSRAG